MMNNDSLNTEPALELVTKAVRKPNFSCKFKYVRYETEDVSDQAGCLPKWEQEYTQLSCGVFEGLLEELSCGPVQLFRERMDKIVDQQGMPWPDSYVIGVPINIQGDGYWYGEKLHNRCAFTLAPNTELKFCTPDRSDILVAALDQKVALSIASTSLDDEQAAQLLSVSGVETINQRIWRSVCCRLQVILSSISYNPAILGVQNARKALLNDILTTILVLLDELSSQKLCEHHSKQFVHRHIVDRTREYILHNYDTPPSIIDICQTLKVSRRTLHYAFQKVLGVSPISFIRYVRLNIVRKELLERDPRQNRITEIAQEFGFWHMGMFSHYYKNLFGELPSETLAKTSRLEPKSNLIIPKW